MSKTKIWNWVGIFAVIGGALWFINHNQSSAPAEPPAHLPEVGITAHPQSQPRWENPAGHLAQLKAQYHELLTAVARNDPEGEALIRFHQEHAQYSLLQGQGATVRVITAAQAAAIQNGQLPILTHGFEVVVATFEERQRNGLQPLSSWQFVDERNSLFAPPAAGHHPILAGVVFAHELTHARDWRERPGDAGTNAEQELRAYDLEFRLLDRALHGRFWSFIDARLSEFRSPTASRSCIRQDEIHPEVVRTLDQLLGPARSIEEVWVRGGVLLGALNLRMARQTGSGNAGMVRCLEQLAGRP